MSYSVANILNGWQERVTRGPKFIDTDHAYIHEGNAFDAFLFSTSTSGVVCRLKTPSTTAARPYVHFRPVSINISGGTVRFRVYDTNTSGDRLFGGSTFDPVNRKYNSTRTAGTEITIGAAASSNGFVLKYDTITFAGTGPGQTRIGASRGDGMEWILKPDTEYALYLSATSTSMGANFFWYEEEDA